MTNCVALKRLIALDIRTHMKVSIEFTVVRLFRTKKAPGIRGQLLDLQAYLSSSNSQMEGEERIDSELSSFIQEQLPLQDVYYRIWVTLKVHSEGSKRRVLVLSNFRLLTIKVNMLGKSVRQSLSLLDLKRISTPSETSVCVFFQLIRCL